MKPLWQKCIPNSKLFAYKVLLGLHFLHGIPAHGRGATVGALENYIKSNFQVDGDIYNQLQTTLMECVRSGFVYKNGNKYLLIGPVAGLQKSPRRTWTAEEVKRVKRIYTYSWTNEKDTARRVNSSGGFLRRVKEALCGMFCDGKSAPRREKHKDRKRNEYFCNENVLTRNNVPRRKNSSEGMRNAPRNKGKQRKTTGRNDGRRNECLSEETALKRNNVPSRKNRSEKTRNVPQNKGKPRKKTAGTATKSILKRNNENSSTKREGSNSRTKEKYYKNRKCRERV